MTLPIPDAALDDRQGFVGTAGSGKTYGAGTAVERVLDLGGRVVIPDALGVWWGLRLLADGATPSPWPIVIFGGEHGDLKLTETAGKLLGETIAGMHESAIVDLSGFPTKAAERRFMFDFLTALYDHANREPVHLILDEADLWCPQTIRDKEGGYAGKLYARVEQIVRRGRVKGFVPWLITQRPAVLAKDVLSQVDGLVAFKLTSDQDRNQLKGWIEGQADQGQWKDVRARLPEKRTGEAVLWLPGHGLLSDVTFPRKRTFDSSRTPKRGEKRQRVALAPLDLGALKERMVAVEEEATANDPERLKAEIARLNRDLQKAQKNIPANIPAPDPKALEAAEQRGYARGEVEGYRKGKHDGGRHAAHTAMLRVVDALAGAAMLNGDQDALHDAHKRMKAIEIGNKDPVAPLPVKRPAPTAAPRQPQASVSHQLILGNGSLPPGERAVLIAAAQFDGVEREQLTVLTGYKRSSRDAYIQRLREKGLIEVDGRTVRATPEGEAALPDDYQPLPTGAALRDYWYGRLPEGERRILEVLVSAYPEALQRSDLDEMTGYKRSSRDAYLQRMKAKRLWESADGGVRASEELF